MISQKEIAEKLGLSRATVSRALRGDQNLRISEETKERIFSFAQKCGYENTKTVLLSHKILIIHKNSQFINQVDNAFYFSLKTGIEETCYEKDIEFKYHCISKLDELEDFADLVLIIGNHTLEDQERILRHPSFQNAHFIVVGKINFFPDSFNWVTYSIKRATKIAVNSVEDHQFDDYYYLGIEECYGVDKKYLEIAHYQRSLQSWGKDFTTTLEGDFGIEGGYKLMESLAQSNNLKNVCIFCQNDPIAIGALQYSKNHNIAIPDDLAIVSINGDQNCQFTHPRLTTVDLNPRIMGVEAVYLALHLLDSEINNVCKIEIQPCLIKGQSS